MEHEERQWGSFDVIYEVKSPFIKIKVKRLHVLAGKAISYQLHHQRREHWFVLSGKGYIVKGDKVMRVIPGKSLIIAREEKHRIEATTENIELLELQICEGNEELREDDIERFPYERKKGWDEREIDDLLVQPGEEIDNGILP